MKTEIKVLLYLKRNGQGKDGLCPLMGRIMVKGTVNSVTQLGCKIKVDPKLWNATSQRCTGKSRMAVTTNREIDGMLLLLQKRYNELVEISDDITAAQIRDAFQGMAEKQVTLMGLFRENNEEYALRVGVNRALNTLYQYKNTYRFMEKFLKEKYKVSDIPFKALDESFIEAFELYLRIDRKLQTGTSIGHVQRLKHIAQIAVNRAVVPYSPFKDFSPMKPKQKQMYLNREELDKLMATTFDTPNRNFTRDMFLFSVFTGICYCDMRNLTEKNVVQDYEGNLWIETRRQKTGTPENVRLLDIAIKIIEKYREIYPSIQEWYMGGHSLGGAMAAEYVSKHVDEFDGLYLFAAYSTADLSDSDLRVFSVYGSEDGVLDMDKYRKYRSNLPEDTYEYVIDGGCHSYFGSYGLQKGDGTPDVAFEEQIEMTVDFITYNSK